ncbi:hypothetical protein [Paenibacillus sp. S-12]|uniref:hypothetical protein n=1 Tax=Paenibacillus sp. S-12 TaxID=3031371 RepID=UPI0025A1E648|nr:hypothetical protein [Paenibacillus sp. S-12]
MRKWMSQAVVLMLVSVLLLTSMSGIASAKSNYLQESAAIGKISSEQMKGKINGISISGYTFRNSFWIPVKQLIEYGFDVAVGGKTDPIRISRNLNKEIKGVKQGNTAPSKKEITVHYTDKEIYVGNLKLTAYQIDNTNVIRLSDLKMFGDMTWEAKSKTIQLKLNSSTYNNELNIWVTDDKVYNRTGQTMSQIQIKHFYLQDGQIQEKFETLRNVETVAAVKGNKQEDNAKRIVMGYLGTVLFNVVTVEGEKVANLRAIEEIDFYKSKTRLEDVKYQLDQEYKIFEKEVKAYLKQELKRNNNQPLKVLGTEVSYDSIGTPKVNVDIINLSEKRVVAFEVIVTGYDSYNRVVRNTITKESSLKGIAQNLSEVIGMGSRGVYTWKMHFHDNMVKASVKVTSVKFSDGTVWRAK